MLLFTAVITVKLPVDEETTSNVQGTQAYHMRSQQW